MKAKSALIASIATVGIASSANAQDFTSAGGTAINGGPHIVDLIIAPSGTIADLDITLNITHAWVGDLNVTLTHVDTGTSVDIFEDVGAGTGSSADLSGLYRFSDESPTTFLSAVLAAGTGVVAPGTYQASNSLDAQTFLSAFDGQNIQGTWRLSILDDYAGSGDGNLTNFTLHMTACLGNTNGDSVVDVNDLLAVITTWGTCPPPPALCPGDIHPVGPPAGNGQVDVNDLLLVVSHWGPCP